MSDKIRRIDWSPDEWIAGTWSVLSIVETAVYQQVIQQCYSRGGLCPNDATYIAKAFREGHWRTVRFAIDALVAMGKLTLSDDGRWLSNGRATRELRRADKRVKDAARAGHEGGKERARRAQARHEVAKNNDLGQARLGNHQPSTINDQKRRKDLPSVGPKESAPNGTPTEGELPLDDPPSTPSKGAPHGNRLPEGWRPTPDLVRYAQDRGLDPDAEADAFADYWRAESGQRASKRDWSAAFRTWCRRSASQRRPNAPPAGAARQRGGVGSFARGLARVLDKERDGQ